MSDRVRELRQLIAEVQTHEAVEDAFLAKSFTDQLLILDLGDGDAVPEEIKTRLRNHDCYSAETVYEDSDGHTSSLGEVGDVTRHHFVDVRTRGSHQSYVAE